MAIPCEPTVRMWAINQLRPLSQCRPACGGDQVPSPCHVAEAGGTVDDHLRPVHGRLKAFIPMRFTGGS